MTPSPPVSHLDASAAVGNFNLDIVAIGCSTGGKIYTVLTHRHCRASRLEMARRPRFHTAESMLPVRKLPVLCVPVRAVRSATLLRTGAGA